MTADEVAADLRAGGIRLPRPRFWGEAQLDLTGPTLDAITTLIGANGS